MFELNQSQLAEPIMGEVLSCSLSIILVVLIGIATVCAIIYFAYLCRGNDVNF